jgi:PEP-CTERM motif
MRYLWLWMLFALPVSAGELQVDISGRAFDSQGQSFGTFAVSFDVDTLSGIQIYNVDSPLVSYAAISLAITNLTADVNGVNIFSVPATLATLTKGASPFTELLTQGPDSLLWDLDVTQSVTISNRDDPLLALLTRSFAPFYADSRIVIGTNGDPQAFLGDEVHVKFTPADVPEPAILALLLLGLVSVGVHHARLRRRPSAARADPTQAFSTRAP